MMHFMLCSVGGVAESLFSGRQMPQGESNVSDGLYAMAGTHPPLYFRVGVPTEGAATVALVRGTWQSTK